MVRFGKRKLKLETIGSYIELERHEEELLHRMHDELKTEIDEENKELIQEKNILKIIEETESSLSSLKEHLTNLKLTLSLMGNITNLSVNEVIQNSAKAAQYSQKLKYNDEQILQIIKTIRTRVNYVKQLSKKLVERKGFEKKIEEHVHKWATEIDDNLKEINKVALGDFKQTA